MYCQLLVSENIFLKYVFEYLEIELEKIIKIGIDNTVHSRMYLLRMQKTKNTALWIGKHFYNIKSENS